MTSQTTALAAPMETASLLWDTTAFEHAQRVAKMFTSSSLVPEHLRGDDHIGDVVIALNIARNLGEDPLTVMQSIYMVKGKAGWSSAYLIARAARYGIHVRWRVKRIGDTPIPYERTLTEWSGAPGHRQKTTTKVKAGMLNLEVTAWAKLPGEAEPVEYTVTSQQAIAAGWADNEQYTHSAELMLRYRSATHLLRLYAPAILLGLPTEDEARQQASDVEYVVEPEAPAPARGLAALDQALDIEEDPPLDDDDAQSVGEVPRSTGSASPQTDAELLWNTLKGRDPKAPLPVRMDFARAQFRGAAGLSSVSEKRWRAALAFGQMQGWWKVTDEALVAVKSAEPEPKAEDPADGAPILGDIGELEALLVDEQVVEAAHAAGLPVVDGEPHLDGAPESLLVKYLEQLRARVRA